MVAIHKPAHDITLNRAGKRQRTRNGFGQRVNQKRAIVTVAEGQTIDIFGN